MPVLVFRNLKAIRFIRCAVPIPGTTIYAGGAGFTLAGALSRCHSERIERQFELQELRPTEKVPVGIAAHTSWESARTAALQEATETFCVQKICSEGLVRCLFSFRIGSFALTISRTRSGYFCLIIGKDSEQYIAAHSAARNALAAVLKAWEEYQSFRFFKPIGSALKNYSRANCLFSGNQLLNLKFQFEPAYVYRPRLAALLLGKAEREGRKIVYLYKPREK